MSDPYPSLAASLEAIEETVPLVVSYTNDVTISAVANTNRHWGGLPVMSRDEREAADMLAGADACLINMGTVDARTEELMVTAGRAASRADVPIVFDPVGAGATPTRSRVAERVVDEVALAIVKGNYGEITALAGEDAEVRGVESVGEYAAIAETAMACAERTGAVVVASGETDVIATTERAYELNAGDEMMGLFVGSGCMLGGTLATFAGGLDGKRPLDAALAGTAAFGIAGEIASDEGSWAGPASYSTALLDAIATFDPTRSGVSDVEERVDVIAEA